MKTLLQWMAELSPENQATALEGLNHKVRHDHTERERFIISVLSADVTTCRYYMVDIIAFLQCAKDKDGQYRNANLVLPEW